MILILHVAGADEAALQRGLATAQAMLNEVRITAAEAALGGELMRDWLRR